MASGKEQALMVGFESVEKNTDVTENVKNLRKNRRIPDVYTP